jgi:voltage-gated potassium channel
MDLRKRLGLPLLAALLVVFAAALGYRLLGGPAVSPLDAIYMAVITIATVGYAEVVDTSGHPALRIFNMAVILVGIGVMLYAFSVFTAFVVEGDLQHLFRRRKMLKQILAMNHHFILCGAGRTGRYVAQELLKAGYPFVVIDRDEEQVSKIEERDEFPVLRGDADDGAVLRSAGLERARGLVTALPDDRDNLMVTVTVRQQNPTIRIVARCGEEAMAEKLVRAGANAAVSPNAIGGLRLASELVRPHVVSFLDVMLREKSKTLRVEEVVVRQGSLWLGQTIHDTELHRRFNLLVLALRRGDGTTFNPPAQTVIAPEDVLVVMGDVNQIWKAREAAGSSP